MRTFSRPQIEEMASKVRDEFKISVPIDDLSEVIKNRLKGDYVERALEESLSGMVEKIEDSFRITINSDHHQNRKNFTIAHEIGHLFLHLGFHYYPEKWAKITEYRDSVKYRLGYSVEEHEANHFAGALLMPRNEYLKFVRDHLNSQNKINPEIIASHFNVSEDAAITRGKWLKVFSW